MPRCLICSSDVASLGEHWRDHVEPVPGHPLYTWQCGICGPSGKGHADPDAIWASIADHMIQQHGQRL